MGALEIVLLIAGGVIFALSFLIPAGGQVSGETRELMQDEVKKMVSAETDSAKNRIEDAVDETVGYAVEKAERSMERISNEKIMAVNEYSDTVLEDINKNHKEVMFLYDMLNDKHQSIRSAVSKVEKAVKQAEETAGEAAQKTAQKTEQKAAGKETEKTAENTAERTAQKEVQDPAAGTTPASAAAPEDEPGRGNSNEQILKLHKAGRSRVEIAKELGLGVGEVKLVIDLFEGM